MFACLKRPQTAETAAEAQETSAECSDYSYCGRPRLMVGFYSYCNSDIAFTPR